MLKIDIFSDVICPWCFIGKRRLERALKERPQQTAIQWRAFQLNPDMPDQGMPRESYIQSKFGGPERAEQIYTRIREVGAGEDIGFRFDLIRRTPNTVKAHRLVHRATQLDKSEAVVEALFTGYFLEGVDIGDDGALVEIAVEGGLDGEQTREFLASDDGRAEVWAETRFAYENNINGVPCFIFNRRYALSGAQDPEAFFPLFDLGAEEERIELPA